MTFKEAFFNSPGPKTKKEAGMLYLKGLMMGAADIVPGVSGGTIALISGIYANLLAAIGSFDLKAIKLLATFKIKDFISQVHLRFLVILLAGIGTAVVSLARIMHFLLTEQPVYTWSAFFGLILASTLILGKQIKWDGLAGFTFVVGLGLAFMLVGLIPKTTPEVWWFIIFAGMIAICAMILPGISGSFLLLILGKYQYITGALRDPFNADSLAIIGLFIIGAVLGITGFSRVLTWTLSRYEMITMAFLTGLMTGSLRKVWPYKEVLETKIIRGKIHILREENFLPTLDQGLAVALSIMIVSFAVVYFLEKQVKPQIKTQPQE
ncbi:MAG: DUF368 domain-containing protein [SAR324 cluster bacterium]|nr:DUF368 domain-containing protein [SAR324 cluster bacterium]